MYLEFSAKREIGIGYLHFLRRSTHRIGDVILISNTSINFASPIMQITSAEKFVSLVSQYSSVPLWIKDTSSGSSKFQQLRSLYETNSSDCLIRRFLTQATLKSSIVIINPCEQVTS